MILNISIIYIFSFNFLKYYYKYIYLYNMLLGKNVLVLDGRYKNVYSFLF